MNQRKMLAEEILSFLKAHAKPNVNYQHEDDNKYNSPDADIMDYTAQCLLNDQVDIQSIEIPHSNYSQGGYAPFNDLKAKQWHDSLIIKLKQLKS